VSDDWGNDPLVPIAAANAPKTAAKSDDWGNDPLVPHDAIPTMTVRPMMTNAERFGTGLKDPLVGGAQLATHMMPGDLSTRMDAYVRGREQDIAETTPNPDRVRETLDEQGRASHVNIGKASGPDPVRMVGNAASPPNLAGAMAGGIPGAALAGAATGALSPVTSDHYWRDKAIQTGAGAVIGAGTGAAGRLFGGAIAPEFRPAAQKLIDAGVELTPGQMAGGVLRRGEEAAKSLPITGTAIRGSELRTIDSFNRATVNHALSPLGIKVPETVYGRELIGEGQRQLSAAYDQLLPHMKFQADQDFATDLKSLHTLVQEMPPGQAQQFEAILQNRVMQRLQPTGTMDGITLKQVESELGHFASNYRSSSDAAQRQLGDAITELQAQIRQALARQNPAQAGRLEAINDAYAMFVRVEGAAVRRPTSEGRFTPGDLLGAIKSADKSVRRRTFARGDALLQDWAQTGQEVIANRMPDSGSPERLLWDIGGGGGAFITHPAAGAGLVAGAAPYTRPGSAMLNYWAADQAPWRKTFGNAVRGSAPYAAPLTTEEIQQRLGMQPRNSGSEALSR
jgi:hypothetical protein